MKKEPLIFFNRPFSLIKEVSCFLLLSLIATAATGQKKSSTPLITPADYECLYEYKVKSVKGPVDAYATILQIGKNCARFMDYTAYETDSATHSQNATASDIEKYKLQEAKNDFYFDQTIYQNVPTGKLSVYSVITPDFYTYKENSRPIQWKLTAGTETICGYVCKKATGIYGGRTWTVWYAPEIPAAFGPWKLCGLPGLVLAASDSEGIHHFSAIAFRKAKTSIYKANIPNITAISRKAFVKAKNKFEEDPMRNLPAEAISSMSVQKLDGGKKGILINGVQIRTHINGYVPLEKE